MLKLKSVVKSREQLLATGWELNSVGNYFKEGSDIKAWVNPRMIGLLYNGVINNPIEGCLDGIDDTWTLHPEMMLVTDQWGFVRDPETLDILMWDVIFGGFISVDSIRGVEYPIKVIVDKRAKESYTVDGSMAENLPPTLSKYPYSLAHGGYTPFDFEELKEAFYCPKVVEGNDDSSNGDSSTTNDDTPDVETVTTYEQDGYQYYLTRRKI